MEITKLTKTRNATKRLSNYKLAHICVHVCVPVNPQISRSTDLAYSMKPKRGHTTLIIFTSPKYSYWPSQLSFERETSIIET